jgi:hypothetical protein
MKFSMPTKYLNKLLLPIFFIRTKTKSLLVPFTYKRAMTTPGLASTTLVTNVDFW